MNGFIDGRCVICGQYGKLLCKDHTRVYRYVPEHGFYALKPRKEVSGPQSFLFKFVRDHYHCSTFQEVAFDFNPYRRYDIIVPSLKLCVEYDGEQHFKFNKLFHKTMSGFHEYVASCEAKENVLKEQGYTVIRFSYIEKIHEAEYVKGKLKRKGR